MSCSANLRGFCSSVQSLVNRLFQTCHKNGLKSTLYFRGLIYENLIDMCDDLSEILDDHSFLSIMGFITGDEYEGTGLQQHASSLSHLASMAHA